MKAFLLSAIFISLFQLNAEAKFGIVPVRHSSPLKSLESNANGGKKLLYYGGPVIGNPKVVAVMWGDNVASDVKSGIGDFFAATVNSELLDWMDQYNTTGQSLDGRQGTNQHIGRGTFAGMVTIHPNTTSGTIDDNEIQQELQRQIGAGTLPAANDDTLYMIYFPPGMRITIEGMGSCSEFCAYHNAMGTPSTNHFFYGVHPDLGGACAFGCGFGDHFGNVTSISAHEFCEAVTDPYPTPGSTPAYPQAWNDNQGQEVGDLCADSSNSLVTSSGKTYKVQSEFDNSAGSCTSRSWRSAL